MIEDELAPWVERHGWDPGAEAYGRLEVLMDLWTRYGGAMNLHGARTRGELVRHVQDGLETVLCARQATAIGPQTRWLDVGSGGGFPILVVVAVVGCVATAMEPRQKRAAFLELAFGAIESGSSRVSRSRIDGKTWHENAIVGHIGGDSGPFEVATARAVFSPADWLLLGRTCVARPGVVMVHGAAADLPPANATIEGTFSPIHAYCFT